MSLRPDLTWRDFQRLSVDSAVPISTNDPSWQKVAKDRLYSHKFGYGKLDASRIVNLARKYKLANKQVRFDTPVLFLDRPIEQGEKGNEALIEFKDKDWEKNRFKMIEHVTVTVHIEHAKRGDVEITLVSPNGYESVLATRRPFDDSNKGFQNWTFLTVKHWDENPIGIWKLKVSDKVNEEEKGTIKSVYMTFWGEEDPSKESTPSVPAKPIETSKPFTSVIDLQPTHDFLVGGNQTNETVPPSSQVTNTLMGLGLAISGSIVCLAVFFKYRRADPYDEYEFESLSPAHESGNEFASDEDDFGVVDLRAEFRDEENAYSV